MGPSDSALKRQGELVAHPALLFQVRGHSQVWELLLAMGCAGLGGGMMQAK